MKVIALQGFYSLSTGKKYKTGDKIECSKEVGDAWKKSGHVKEEKPKNKKAPITKKGAISKK